MTIYRNHTTLEHTYQVRPDQMNPFNIMHGGSITTIMDDTAGTCCYRWCQDRVSTASFHHIRFLAPLYTGDRLTVTATIIHSGHSSLTAIVYVVRNNEGETPFLAAWAVASFVRMKNDRETKAVPPLMIEDEKARAMAALAVQIKNFSKALDPLI